MIQRLNAQLHRWNQNTIFSIDELRKDTGWEPTFTFETAVEHTYEWFRREGLDKERQYDWAS
jgi:nucleoside-diphosphate-sugar epimerase